MNVEHKLAAANFNRIRGSLASELTRSIKAHADAIAPRGRLAETDDLSSGTRGVTALVPVENPSAERGVVTEIDRFLVRVRHEEVEVRRFIEDEMDFKGVLRACVRESRAFGLGLPGARQEDNACGQPR